MKSRTMRRKNVSNQGCSSKQSSATVEVVAVDNFFQPFFTQTPTIISKKEVHTLAPYINIARGRKKYTHFLFKNGTPLIQELREIGANFECISTLTDTLTV